MNGHRARGSSNVRAGDRELGHSIRRPLRTFMAGRFARLGRRRVPGERAGFCRVWVVLEVVSHRGWRETGTMHLIRAEGPWRAVCGKKLIAGRTWHECWFGKAPAKPCKQCLRTRAHALHCEIVDEVSQCR